jgi:hypothetical protein
MLPNSRFTSKDKNTPKSKGTMSVNLCMVWPNLSMWHLEEYILPTLYSPKEMKQILLEISYIINWPL